MNDVQPTQPTEPTEQVVPTGQTPEEAYVSITPEQVEKLKKRFADWVEENMAEVVLVQEALAQVIDKVSYYHIKPVVLYMHLKVLLVSMEKDIFTHMPDDLLEEAVERKKEVDGIAQALVLSKTDPQSFTEALRKKKGKGDEFLKGYQ